MKAGWEVRTLDTFSEIKYGYTAKADSQPVGPKFLRITDLQNRGVNWNNVPYCKISPKEHDKHKVIEGDIVFARTGATTGKSFLVRGAPDAVCASYLIKVRCDQRIAVPEFLSFFFLTNIYWAIIELGIEGAAQGGFNASKLGEIGIPLPPLEEQQRIVAILDEAFEGLDRARANAEANLQNARELFESVREQALLSGNADGREVLLGDIAEITSNLVDPRENQYLDLPHVGAGNMVTGSDQLIDIKTAREEQLKSGKHPFDESMVLYSKIRPYLRKVARPDFSGLCSADVYPLVPKPCVIARDFLFHILLSENFTKYAISGSDRAGMPKVNRDHLFTYKFVLPPLETQNAICQSIDDVQAKAEDLLMFARTKLQDLADLRQSLLQKAFAGELT